MPINLSTFLQPPAGNTFYLLEDKYLKGGYQVVANVTDRDAINFNNRKQGMLVYTIGDGKTWRLNAGLSTWTEVMQRTQYDIADTITDRPSASQLAFIFKTPRAFVIPANCENSQAQAASAATTLSVFSIQKNNIEVATMRFAALAATGTFSTQAEIHFAVGDVLKVVAPITRDETLADIYYTFAAYLE